MGLDSAGGFQDGGSYEVVCMFVSVYVEGAVMSLLINPSPSQPLNEPIMAVIFKLL